MKSNRAIRTSKGHSRRKVLSWIGLSLCSYPLIRFVLHAVPKKPIIVEITNQAPASGVIIHQNFILFDRDDQCWALSRKCTHLGCKLTYHEKLDLLECPCHHSRFDCVSGEVLRGPAKKSLPFFAVEKRDNAPRYVVTT